MRIHAGTDKRARAKVQDGFGKVLDLKKVELKEKRCPGFSVTAVWLAHRAPDEDVSDFEAVKARLKSVTHALPHGVPYLRPQETFGQRDELPPKVSGRNELECVWT